MDINKEYNIRRELYYLRKHYSFKAIITVALKMLAEEKQGERFI